MGEHSGQLASDRRQTGRKQPPKQTPDVVGRRLLDVIVYDRNCRIGGQISVDDLETTEVGDWTMPQFRAACAYGASQGWLIVQDDVLTLTTAGLASA